MYALYGYLDVLDVYDALRGTVRVCCIGVYSRSAVKVAVKKSGMAAQGAPQEVWDGVGRCLGVLCMLDDDDGGSWLP